MRRHVVKVWDYLRSVSPSGNGSRKTPRSARPSFEVLEDRCVPTSGSVSGLVFLNSPGNGLPGAMITLTGSPTGSPSMPVNLTAFTDSNGSFTFSGLPAGTYQLSAGPFPGILGSTSIGGVSASPGVVIAAPVSGNSGQNFVIHGGLDLQLISLDMFLNTSTNTDFPFEGSPGAGTPDNTPVVTADIGNQALSSASTSKVIDLAGHFGDRIDSNSAVTMNITANGTTNDVHINLLDSTAPQTVANFYDYVNAGAYNNSFFHRETTVAKDNIGVLQGGGATITNGTGPSVITPVLPTIPDEIATSNTKGTLAMANTGAVNTASDQFFFNVVDNTSLDAKFTVFGNVADAASQTVLDTLGATPVQDLHTTAFATANPSLLVNEVPLNGGAVADFPTDSSKYLVINSITTTKRDDFLTYSIVSNSNPALVTAALTNEQLTLTKVTGTGSATIVVQAIDRFGASVTQSFTVTVS